MVGTRRSSRRLQEKSEAASSDEKHTEPSPVKTPTRRSRNTTPVKKSPASASKTKTPTPTKRGRSKAVKALEQAEEEREVIEVQEEHEVVVVDDDSVEEIPVPEQDAAETEEEEEVVMMLPDSNGEQQEENEETQAEETHKPEELTSAAVSEDDILSYALMAASGLNLSTTTASTTSDSNTSASTKSRRPKLVPDELDSGASKDAYFQFNGQRCSNGAQLMATKRSSEETQVVAKQHQVSAVSEQQRAEAKNVKSAGRKWFNMASEDMTPEARRDFALLRMRNYLDPKKFYKTSDHHKNLPKHFQLGTVIEGAHEFKSARLVKKDRRQTFTEEIMADQQVQTYTKRVYTQVNNARSGTGRKKQKMRK